MPGNLLQKTLEYNRVTHETWVLQQFGDCRPGYLFTNLVGTFDYFGIKSQLIAEILIDQALLYPEAFAIPSIRAAE